MTQTQTLDPAQEIRIKAVHRGFLYQHLYVAACLLTSDQIGATSIVVERDEDIEFITPAGRTYIQVKTRSQAIMPADVSSALSGSTLCAKSTCRADDRAGRPLWWW